MDAFDRLKLNQAIPAARRPRFLTVTPGTVSPPSGGPFPSSEPPGTIVPTVSQTFLVASEGWAARYSGPQNPDLGWVPTSQLVWPPEGWLRAEHTDQDQTIGTFKLRIESWEAVRSKYEVWVALLRFDTSSLPDNAQIVTAVLRLFQLGATIYEDTRNLTFEWHEWTPPRGSISDWTAVEEGNANSGILVSQLPTKTADGWTEIPLSNAQTNVNKTGYTYLRAHISGGAPTQPSHEGYFGNWRGAGVAWASKNRGQVDGSGNNTAAQLVIHYG